MISAGRPIKKGFKEMERLFFLGSEENVLLTNMGRQSENRVKLTVPVILLLIGLLLQIAISTGHANEGKTMSADHGKTSAHGGIILMRHGEAEHNVENRFNSAPGHPAYTIKHLTSLGQEQARKSGDELLVSHGVPVFVMLDLLTGTGEKISPASYRIIHTPSICNAWVLHSGIESTPVSSRTWNVRDL